MATIEKDLQIQELAGKAGASSAVFLIGYKGCKCSELTSLRRKLDKIGSQFEVVKNTLAKRAIKESNIESLSEHFVGQTAVVWTEKDAVASAKALTEFAKDVESFKLKAGVVDGSVVDVKQIEALAKMPSREQILAQLLSLINAPAQRLLQTINAPASSLVRLLGAWKGEVEKKQ